MKESDDVRLTISMPDQMNEWVEAQIRADRYGNVSEYFRDLVRRDQERREAAIGELRTMLDRAEASGISERSVGRGSATGCPRRSTAEGLAS